ncbi:hypothetical protein HY478_03620 [Candidatus Uhrbacteria bacterium]|nr:hypothetical protein [Candidatus Uhrbacteria bacterium]
MVRHPHDEGATTERNTAMSVKLINYALDEDSTGDGIIARGRLVPETIQHLKLDTYQREVMSLATEEELRSALLDGTVPDIELAMRGWETDERDGFITLKNPVYIVDGQQRIAVAHKLIAEEKKVWLGATVHFGSTRAWEVERFRILNAQRIKLSPNVLARNEREHSKAVAAIYRACLSDAAFALKDRVCWNQRLGTNHLITAVVLLKTVGELHGHLGPGRGKRLDELVAGLRAIMEKTGEAVLLENMKTFFGLIEDCWGIKVVTFRGGPSYLKSGFLWSLARLFSEHTDFWRGTRLLVTADLSRKLKIFPVTDPTVCQLASVGGQSKLMLYELLLQHMNRGKRHKRLTPRLERGGRKEVAQVPSRSPAPPPAD